MQRVTVDVTPCGMCNIARSVLVGQFLLFSLCSKRFFAYLRGMEVRRNEKITFRCTALEKAALSEQAARCGMSTSEYCRSLSLGGRQYREVFEENRTLITELQKILSR